MGIDAQESRGEAEKYYGKYPGLVLENTPPEDAAHRGALLVEVPGILEETPDGADQRPIQVLAKPCFLPGFFFVPEVGAQVWVEFVAGNVNSAVWTGVWYPADAAPQTTDGEGPTEFQKVIRTASGQVIQLDDSDEAQKLVVTDETNGNTITLDADGVRLEDANNAVTMDSNGVRIEDGNGNAITLDGNGITFEAASSTITMSSSGIKLEVGASSVAVEAAAVKVTDAVGAQQLVVLAPLLEWLLAHQHTGNMGAPTPPFPADVATFMAQKDTMFKSGAG
jgi:hypothetical protein